MLPNIFVWIVATLVPFFFGYVWFHPKVFGGETWYQLAKLRGEDRKPATPLNLVLSLVLNFLIAFGMFAFSVHQIGAFGMVGAEMSLLESGVGGAFMDAYGDAHLSFGHGVFHGIFPAVVLFVIPIVGYVTLFESKSWKYFLVYVGYWTVSLCLMGGLMCEWGLQGF